MTMKEIDMTDNIDMTIHDAVKFCINCLNDLEKTSVREVRNAVIEVVRKKLHEIDLSIEAQNAGIASLNEQVYFDAITFDGAICPHVTKEFLNGMRYHIIRGYNRENQVIKEDEKYASLCEDYNSLVKRMNERVHTYIKNGTFFTDKRFDESDAVSPETAPSDDMDNAYVEHLKSFKEHIAEDESSEAEDDSTWVTAEEFFGSSAEDQVKEAVEHAEAEQKKFTEVHKKLCESYESSKRKKQKRVTAKKSKKDNKDEEAK